ncbi:MAG: hypothetical protein IT168_00440 [Bryobacterales bacterium]|nr:hypothetical protein [Bryobacterales bacterium]
MKAHEVEPIVRDEQRFCATAKARTSLSSMDLEVTDVNSIAVSVRGGRATAGHRFLCGRQQRRRWRRPGSIPVTDPGVDLASKTVCIKVRLSTMGNTRKVSTSQIEADADKSSLRVSKHLLDSAELKAIGLAAYVESHSGLATNLNQIQADVAEADARRRGHPGRLAIKGARLPSLQSRLVDRKTRRQTATVPNWYGNTGRRVQFCCGTAIWYHGGLPPALIRWVLIRDPEGRFEPLALLCTDPHDKPLAIIADYVCRWQLEVTFEEVRAHLGVETNANGPIRPALAALLFTLRCSRW